ncbi:MAG: 3-dehydroquinate synthase [Actinomycetota bacterium]
MGRGLIGDPGVFPIPDGVDRAFAIADRTVSDRWFSSLAEALSRRAITAVLLPVPEGEEAKSLHVYQAVLQQLAVQRAHRDDVVVALGGGSVGDLAGFVASTYMRGVPCLQVPTTLLAQVDAAIGGKTAVNLPEGKNLVGTFAQPVGVIADVDPVRELPERAFRSGLAEVAKYALTLDAVLLSRLEADPAALLSRDPAELEDVVARCVGSKSRVVVADERDAGERLFLNYGHTLGHALERLDAFAGRSHGEAVAVGMVFAARLAESRGDAQPGLAARTVRLLSGLGLEPGGRLPDPDAVIDAIALDKKYRRGMRFVLLRDVGEPFVAEDVGPDEVRAVLGTMGASR